MRTLISLSSFLILSTAQAAPPVMTLLAPANHTMPFANFQNGEMVGGFLKDFGDVLAKRIGYTARFHTVPGKRVALALIQGEADGVCFVAHNWIDGDFKWTRPIIPATGVIVAHTSAPVINAIRDLANERLGTVLGYRYPELEVALGTAMLRDDAPSVQHSIAKLGASRSRYAVVDGITIAYHMKLHPQAPMRVDFVYLKYKASCAFALTSPVKLADVDRALAAMANDGTIEALFDKYR
ncbi:MAG: transporter substrate-binding domain-containing protein [Pseudomonadota bacterium]